MATLSEISRQRKSDLKTISKWSRSLDAAQEKVEREVKRVMNRKRSVPEQKDAMRILELMAAVSATMSQMASVISDIANTW